MARRKAFSALITILILTSVISQVIPESRMLIGESESETDESNQLAFHGQSFLNITGPILPNTPVNASWFAEVTVPESYGTELLENRSLGLLGQIDAY